MRKGLLAIITILVFTHVVPTQGIGNENNSLKNKIVIETKDKLKETKNKKKKKKEKYKTGYICVNQGSLKHDPKKHSKIKYKLCYGTKIKYKKFNNNWYIVRYKHNTCYIFKKRVSKKELKSIIKNAPVNNSIKSWMGYSAITNTASLQYRLQHTKAYTGKYGIRQVYGRYCIALGSYYTRTIGQYVDIILMNGTIMPCIIADCKADCDTDSMNIMHPDGSLVEFVVDTSVLNSNARRMGDISYANKKWMSKVKKVKLYKKKVSF